MSKTKRCRCVIKTPGSAPDSVFPGNPTHCSDVCTSPICGDPRTLTLMAPVIYDQLGLNLCSPVALPGLETFPSAHHASVQVINVEFGAGTEVQPLTGRPNCYQITLSNLTVTFAIRVYDCACRLLTTLNTSAVYLPPEGAENYDEETNPDSVQFDLFAPYGVTFVDGAIDQPLLNYIGFSSVNARPLQGLNVTAFARLLNLDTADSTAVIGLTLYVASLYYAQYQFGQISRADIPKISLIPEDDTLCQNFVEGDLLNLTIRPLDLGAPLFEEQLKRECPTPCPSCCGPETAPEPAPAVNAPEPAAEQS